MCVCVNICRHTLCVFTPTRVLKYIRSTYIYIYIYIYI